MDHHVGGMILKITNKAIFVAVYEVEQENGSLKKFKDKEVWFPLSQLKGFDKDPYHYPMDTEIEFICPRWLVQDKGVA